MSDKFAQEFFGDGLLDYVKERSDDFDKAVIFGPGAVFSAPDGKSGKTANSFGMIFYFVGGERKIIGKDDAEIVLNDGILHRMKVKIEFLK